MARRGQVGHSLRQQLRLAKSEDFYMGPGLKKIRVCNSTRGNVLAESAEVADHSAARRKGLLGRSQFTQGEGLWITPCESVHTCGMKFGIDVVFLDRSLRVRKLRENLIPWRMSMHLFAESILELPTGAIRQSGTRVGDQLRFTETR